MSRLLHAPHGLRPSARRLALGLLLALLLATLAPGISRILSVWTGGLPEARPDGHWVQLCTTQGTRWVRVEIAGTDRGPGLPDPAALDRCGHCTLATERFAPLMPTLPLVPVVAGSWPLPLLAGWAGIEAPARTARARGPPLRG